MKILPVRPDVEHLKRQARRLRRAYRGADPASLATVRHYDAAFGVAGDEALADSSFSILDAQRVIARQHGFRSWPSLAGYVARARGGSSGKDRALAERLLALRDDNVAAIKRVRKRSKGNSRGRYIRELAGPQERDAEILHEIFDQLGWPTVERIGHAAMEATYTVVGNLFTQGPLNRAAIEHMGARVGDGQAPAGWLAVLRDRADFLGVFGSATGSSATSTSEGV